MDLWIMGLLYELIVRGSGLRGAFGEKGLFRSAYPTGGMCGWGPALVYGGHCVWTNKRWEWETVRNVTLRQAP